MINLKIGLLKESKRTVKQNKRNKFSSNSKPISIITRSQHLSINNNNSSIQSHKYQDKIMAISIPCLNPVMDNQGMISNRELMDNLCLNNSNSQSNMFKLSNKHRLLTKQKFKLKLQKLKEKFNSCRKSWIQTSHSHECRYLTRRKR